MQYQTVCPNCQTAMLVSADQIGEIGQCARCGQSFPITVSAPAGASAPAGSVPVARPATTVSRNSPTRPVPPKPSGPPKLVSARRSGWGLRWFVLLVLVLLLGAVLVAGYFLWRPAEAPKGQKQEWWGTK
jgi:predicted Zn finger-like uncharacterized protein